MAKWEGDIGWVVILATVEPTFIYMRVGTQMTDKSGEIEQRANFLFLDCLIERWLA